MTEVPLMVMPWHRPDPCKPLRMQTDAAFKSSYLDYLATLRLDSPPLELPLTTIAGTIGPASNNVDMLVDLMQLGLSIALVPLALGTRQEQLETIANIRTANSSFANMRNIVYPLAIAVQTKGPGLRLGGLVKDVPLTLPLHHKLTLTTDKAWRTKGTEHYLYINFPEMCHVLKEGDVLLVGSGIVILQVEFIDKTECKCIVVGAGNIQSFMAVTVPDVPLNMPPLTDEDVDDLMMAAEMGVDIVVVSHTQTEELVKDVRRILDEQGTGSGIKIWAQIESNEALNNLECILKSVDAIVFSRISLLQDIAPEKLFLAQKIVLSTCNKVGVPIFVSSHFLPSMQVATSPSIAEVYDVTSAILDGVDGFLMRNTVSHGKHPDLAVRTLSKVCVEAEAAVWHHQTFSYLNAHAPAPLDPTHCIAIAAVDASLKSSATLILLTTTSGRSAQLVARYRPRCPIIAITRYGQVARQLNSWRAIIPLHYVDPPLPEWMREVDLRFQFGIEFAKHKGIVRPGDVMVLMNGWRQGAGFTNTIRIVYASDSFPWVYPHKLPDSIPSDSDVKEQEQAEDAEKTSRPRTAIGDRTDSRVVTILESSSMHSASLTSRIRSMEEEYKTIASIRSKEIEDKMLDSLQLLKSDSLSKKSFEKGRTKMDRELSIQDAPTVTQKTETKMTRAITEMPTATRRLSGAPRKSREGSMLESASVRGSQQSNEGKRSSMMSAHKTTVTSTKNPTVVSAKTPTTVSAKAPTVVADKNPTVVSAKAPTVVSDKDPTVVADKALTVVADKNPTVVSAKAPTMVAEKAPTVVADKAPTVVADKAPTVVADKAQTVVADKAPTVVADKAPTVVADKARTVVADKNPTVVSAKTPTVHETQKSTEAEHGDAMSQVINEENYEDK